MFMATTELMVLPSTSKEEEVEESMRRARDARREMLSKLKEIVSLHNEMGQKLIEVVESGFSPMPLLVASSPGTKLKK